MKTLIPVIVAVVCLAIGVVAGRLTGDSAETENPEALASARTELQQEIADLQEKNESLTDTNTKLEEEIQTLRTRVYNYQGEIASLEEKAKSAADDPSGETAAAGSVDPNLPIMFGDYSDLEALLNADWETLAGAIVAMNPDMEKLFEMLSNGEELDMELAIRIQKENQKLAMFALEANGKLPTHATGNGEYTHPIATSNLMAQVLENGENPLTEAQKRNLVAYGEDYEEEWDRVNSAYAEDTTKIHKLMDEIALKKEFMERAEANLSPSQQEALFAEGTRDIAGFDLWSPAISFTGYARPVPVNSTEDLRAKIVSRTSNFLGISEDTLNRHPDVFDTWVTDVEGSLKPVKSTEVQFFGLDDGLQAGRAQARALEELLNRLDLSDEERQKIIESQAFFVPRLVGQD